MQIDLLDTFLDLAETRSFHRTAEKLGITQSTVSARISALEEAVGSRLFDRSRAGTDLTPEGTHGNNEKNGQNPDGHRGGLLAATSKTHVKFRDLVRRTAA